MKSASTDLTCMFLPPASSCTLAALESQLRLCPDCTGDVGSCSPACVPARGQTCDSADMLAVPLLCYSSLQELRDLFALKLQVSMLHQEIALQKVGLKKCQCSRSKKGKKKTIVGQQLLYKVLLGSSSIASSPSDVSVFMPCSLCW